MQEPLDKTDKVSIRLYVEMATLIRQLKYEKQNVSKNYYLTHSFYGSGMNDDIEEVYTHATPVEKAALDIVDKERALQKRIDKLEERYSQFRQVFSKHEIKHLKKCQRYDDFNHMERRALKLIQQIESEARYKTHAKLKRAYSDRYLEVHDRMEATRKIISIRTAKEREDFRREYNF